MEYIREATKFDIDEISNMNQDFPVSECHNVMNIIIFVIKKTISSSN